MLPIDDSMTGYTLARHPRNRAIVDIRNNTTNELKYIKIRHRLANFYAISLVDPRTFDVWAETQVKSASTRLKPITLQGDKNSVQLKDTSLFGFEWTFEWENQKYKWVRESPIRSSLECKAITSGRTGNICIARYLPRGPKDEYFGLITILDDTTIQVQDKQAMELLLITSLMTILDKANNNSWKKEKSSGALFLEPSEIPTIHHPDIYRGTSKYGYEDWTGTDNDEDDDDDSSGNSSKNDDGKQHDGIVDNDTQKHECTNDQQKSTTASKNSSSSSSSSRSHIQQKSIDGNIDYASQPIPKGGGSSTTHDLRSHHQRQQVEYLGHMLSAMKHLGNATATLPPSFVQHSTSTSWAGDSIEGGQQSLQTMWHRNKYRNININNNNINDYHHQHLKYNNDMMEVEQQETISHRLSSSSQRYNNNHHHRTRSHRRISSIDPFHWVPFSRHRQLQPAPSFGNNINLQHSIPGPHQQYHLH